MERRLSRPAAPRCPACGYDLRGTMGTPGDAAPGPCPECGQALDATNARSSRERAFFRRFGGWLAAGVLAAVIAVAVILVGTGERAALFAIPLVLFVLGWLPFVLVARLTRDIE